MKRYVKNEEGYEKSFQTDWKTLKSKLKIYKNVKEFGKALGLSEIDMKKARQKRRSENLKNNQKKLGKK